MSKKSFRNALFSLSFALLASGLPAAAQPPQGIDEWDSGVIKVRVNGPGTLLLNVCSLDGGDDHGDSFLCATGLAVGETVDGAIGDAGDRDVFSFALAAAATVEIESFGTTDVSAWLHGAEGALVATVDGQGGNVHLFESLAPGRYFLRIAGSNGAEGSYQVSVSSAGSQ
ncbi:MAG TPA: hypothetical protein VLQ45_20485 [Thermoanaerobaculia bacterium]|nr:hypothetical protein [Thermoanaerobaculia bacterium]